MLVIYTTQHIAISSTETKTDTYWSSFLKIPQTTLTETQNTANSNIRICGRLWK